MNQQLPFPTGDVGTVRMKPRRASNVLLWAILLFLVVFVVWAHFTELDRTVRGQGRVVPSAQLQTVSNLEGGVVEEILVRTGDDIARGSPIIRLSPVASTAELGATQSQYAALGTKIERLGAEVGGRAPSLGGSAAQVSAERQLYQARTAELASLSAAGQARVVAAERAVAEARAAYDARQSALSAARTELSSIAPLVRAGIEPQLSLTKAESAVAIAGSEAAAAAAAVTRASAQVAEARAASSQARQDWRARSADELAAAQSERAARGQPLVEIGPRDD